MDIGRTNKRVTFCRYAEEENELKQMQQYLKPIRTVWASVEPKSGKELVEANKDHPELTYVITVRYQKDITSDMYIKYKDRLFEIKAPPRNIREANEMLEIICTEKTEERREVVEEGR
ncbi:MAG: phage head closure protein [Lachnospiraceae bacterium]|nr:phage head closure protein [Lachnospiraceae bacterium]